MSRSTGQCRRTHGQSPHVLMVGTASGASAALAGHELFGSRLALPRRSGR
jgi:hypothetical protein